MLCRRFFFFLLIPVSCHVLCRATTLQRLSLEDAVAQAEWIVSGDVVRTWCGWDRGHRFIWTHTEIAVHDRWKGSTGATVTVSEPGGVVDGMGLSVPGMVRYAPGEQVVVFLYRTPIGLIRTVGLAQGKLLVDSRGLVHPSLSDADVSSANGQPAGTSIGELEASSLSRVHDRIARIAAQKAVRK